MDSPGFACTLDQFLDMIATAHTCTDMAARAVANGLSMTRAAAE